MDILASIEDLKHYRSSLANSTNPGLGFVPTMGGLHPGHLSLVERAKKDNQVTLVSIFVNPAQFAPQEDFKNYPRSQERDLALLRERGVEAVFFPAREMLYPEDFDTWVSSPTVSRLYEGITRPHFFTGVLTIVLKLFNLVQPTRAYFGKKDYQQLLLVQKMVEELHLGIEVIGCPLIREPSGLAMSSRNVYLSEQQREVASRVYQSLKEIKKMALERGAKEQGREKEELEIITQLKKRYSKEIALVPGMKVDYFEVVDKRTCQPQTALDTFSLFLTAVFFHHVRLIDNLELYD